MLLLSSDHIQLNQSASNKHQAIQSIAADLTAKGWVETGYIDGMLAREAQYSTYLGSGIAIPHGTVETRPLVNTTGVVVHHFPQGVDWGDGNRVYLALGIAAKSDEHLGILKQITQVLADDDVAMQLQTAQSSDQILALLSPSETQSIIAEPCIALDFPAKDMLQLMAVAGGLLKNAQKVDAHYIADIITQTPTHLGKGIWLIGSSKGVKKTAVSVVSVAQPFEYQTNEVRLLLTCAAIDHSHQPLLTHLAQLIFKQQHEQLLNANLTELMALLTAQPHTSSSAAAPLSDAEFDAIFTVKNAHGLHARPGAILVATTKRFDSRIEVTNLDGNGTKVNAKSLMKVIGLGVKKGHRLAFTAEGEDAAAALEAIGAVIESGLGEGAQHE